MRPISYYCALTFVFALLFSTNVLGQTFGTTSSAVWLTTCTQNDYYNTSGSGGGLIGPAGNTFHNANLGAFTRNTGTLVLRGGEVRTFKVPGTSNVCSVRMYYRTYLQSGTPGAFTAIELPFADDCNVATLQYPSGGSCVAGEQKWKRVIADGTTVPYSPVNLTTLAAGNYVLEVYYDVAGSNSSTSLCNETVVLDNGGSYYKAYFSIQAPTLASSNPTTCDGTEGSITINGLVPGLSYTVSYLDDFVPAGPLTITANGIGQVIITGLNAGSYSGIELTINGCTTEFNTELTLSDYVKTPIFTPVPSFCAGSTAPTLPTVSNNGVTGSWSPAVVSNTASGVYTFTADPGQCGKTVTMNVTVNPNVTPTFSFGTALTVCSGGSVPALPGTSTNGITGTWSPASVDNTASGTYTFTPSAGQCATSATFTVTVQSNVTTTFNFGTSLTICAGGGVPALPSTSSNGVTGSWSPSAVSNTASGSYTFTPTTGQCASVYTYDVTVNPNVAPTFSFGTTLTICAGASVPTLPGTSDNGITGTWSPATVSNTVSGTYTFTPTAGQCATTASFAVTVNQNVTPSFAIGTSLTICEGGTVPTLPATSSNGINGSWSPATVSNTASGNYTFTPTAGQCATTASFSVTVNPNITPTFSFGTALTICAGGGVPALPNTSTNGITGSWSPATVSNQTSGTYTFTPSAGQCATNTTYTVTVGSNTTPTFSFGTAVTICSGATAPVLPGTSGNGISGTWSPSTVNNTASGTYTFTPSAGQCAVTTTLNVTVDANVTPTFSFGTSLTICAGGSVPALPGTSSNSITGTWSPASIDDQNSATYTFTPDAGQCAPSVTLNVTVNPNVTPTFSFGTSLAICEGGAVPALPNTSSNGITGTWSPATIDNQASGTYTFTPTAGLCATTTTYSVNVTPNTTPAFSFGSSLAICAGEAVPALPGTSSNGVTGTWSPATVDDQASGTYTFTPSAGQCATPFTYSVTVYPIVTPTFSFGTSYMQCTGSTPPALPTTSQNGVTGTWSPAAIDDQNSGTYTFTPDAAQCATGTTLTVTVSGMITPTFSFGTSMDICSGESVPALPATSQNGLTGTWSPAAIDNQASGTYTFTPAAGQCGSNTTLTVNVTPTVTPLFSFGTSLAVCAGGTVPALPATSDNSIPGSWSPATVDNQASGTYTFTPDPAPGQCYSTTSFAVTVNPIVTPTFEFGNTKTICAGSEVPVLPATSANGITGSWSPAVVSNQASGTYTFTADPGQCATPSVSFNVTINPLPAVTNLRGDTLVNDGSTVPSYMPSGNSGSVNFSWTNSNPVIGLGASGTGNVPSFTATNTSDAPISGTIIITPEVNGCTGTAVSYVVTVKPLFKDVFVPNVFSPNNDGKNDVLLVYGNYIQKLQMRIFNQWGQQVIHITSQNQGWDGKFKGKAQPVGVYVYVLEAYLIDGRRVSLKGHISLLR